MFSKIKNRRSLHPSAIYRFFQTFARKNAKRNIRITLVGYQNALQELIDDDNPQIDIIMHGNMFCLTNSDHITNSSSIGKPRIEKNFMNYICIRRKKNITLNAARSAIQN
jgi:hypothetical protein